LNEFKVASHLRVPAILRLAVLLPWRTVRKARGGRALRRNQPQWIAPTLAVDSLQKIELIGHVVARGL